MGSVTMYEVMPGRVDTILVSSEQRMYVPRVSVKSALARASTAPRLTDEYSSSNNWFFLPLSWVATRLFSLAMRRCIRSSLGAWASASWCISVGSDGISALATTSAGGGGGSTASFGLFGTVTSS